jgi:aryl-alcohol dehydrogenase-like predicted oxidoreductase
MSEPARVRLAAFDVFPLCLGTNIFGWTVDERGAFAVLDAYLAAGGNFLDTADRYSEWVPGNVGGESEAIIGRWLSSRRARDRIVIATKVGALSRHEGLAPDTVRAAVEGSLRRLGTDHIDLLYAHRDDQSTELDEALAGLDAIVREGKARSIGASNYTAARLAGALEVSDRLGLARFAAIQPLYNLVERAGFEAELQALCDSEGIACIPHSGLAQGFLTGKYRIGHRLPESSRADGARVYLDDRGTAVLAVLDEIAAARTATVAATALAWLRSRSSVVAPVASARTPEQLAELLPMVELELNPEEIERLNDASGERAAVGSDDTP